MRTDEAQLQFNLMTFQPFATVNKVVLQTYPPDILVPTLQIMALVDGSKNAFENFLNICKQWWNVIVNCIPADQTQSDWATFLADRFWTAMDRRYENAPAQLQRCGIRTDNPFVFELPAAVNGTNTQLPGVLQLLIDEGIAVNR